MPPFRARFRGPVRFQFGPMPLKLLTPMGPPPDRSARHPGRLGMGSVGRVGSVGYAKLLEFLRLARAEPRSPPY